jgi:KDO2-lipid IV(A) lauroyltransferase
VDWQHRDHLDEVLARGRGAITATGHLGNFELISYLFNMTSPSMLAVGRSLDNPYLNDYLWATRERMGERVISKKGALKRIALALRHGDCVGFVPDQDAGRRGIFADLFGKKASSHASFAALALKMKVAVVPGYACRVGYPMKYRIYADRPIEPVDTGDWQRDLQAIVQEFNHRLEKYITEFPEQWLWTHRRWRTRQAEKQKEAETKKGEVIGNIAAGGK